MSYLLDPGNPKKTVFAGNGLNTLVENNWGVLDYPMHMVKSSLIMLTDEDQKMNDSIFAGLPSNPLKLADITLVLESRTKVPDCLDVTALTEDDLVMSISRHKTVPFVAV